MSKVLIAGGGAAGMFAAITAARQGQEVHVYEKNEKLGKKLFITGKGRCNITNACDMDTLFDSVITNSKFLYSSFYGYTNQDVIDFFENIGVQTKTERGERVFPQSDHSSDVIRALEAEMRRLGVHIHLHTGVKQVISADGSFAHIELMDGSIVKGDSCIVATGGLSYQTTGSTGDGYRFARDNGHTVTDCMPSLVPMTTKEEWVPRLQGLSLRNVRAAIFDGKKKLYDEELKLTIDLKPALSMEQLEKRVLRDFEENQNRQFKNAVGKLFPSKLIPVMIELSGIGEEKKVNVISREERQKFVSLIKNLPVTLTGLRGYNEAIITKGGVKVKEIDPATMESKLVKGLYFAGEVLDLDAVTGGFNLQIAWSTAYAAGMAVSE